MSDNNSNEYWVVYSQDVMSEPILVWFMTNLEQQAIHNAFLWIIASSKHMGSWENTSRVGKPRGVAECLDDATLHGNKLYISFIK